jgi:hypothetical protein
MSERKRFDRELFEKYDKAAREVTTKVLKAKGYDVVEHPNRYAQDLIAYMPLDDYEFHVECEVKRVWKEDTFPYDSVQLPTRKEKFFDGKTQFFIWNLPMTHAATFWCYDVANLTPVEVPNKYMYKDEYFFQIPLDKVEFISVDA